MRVRVVDHLLDSRGSLRVAGTDWVAAYSSLELDSVNDLVVRLVDHLNRPRPHDDRHWAWIAALERVRLDAAEAAKAAADLRARLDRPNLDGDTQQALIDAVGRVGARLDSAEAAETANYSSTIPITQRPCLTRWGGSGAGSTPPWQRS
jgi:hypothetical protein